FVFLWLLGIKASLKHREYFHSVLAGIIVSFFNSAMILIVLKYFNFLNPVRILTLFFGFLSGFILHLLEDSTTVSGVALLFPFSDLKIHGNIHTSKDVFYCLTLTISLIFSIFLSFYLNLLFPANFILLLLVWFVFYRIASIRVASF
ncbi:MAG: metal-dependent hydrolase, partial [archaeon]